MTTSPTILVVLGNRPQFIKHAALASRWKDRLDEAQPVIIDTGQHYDHSLAGVFMDELSIPTPDFSLGVGSASHAEQLARMLPPLEEIMVRAKPSSVVLYGDTNSTLGGALVASKLHIPIAHIEAGLRSYDMRMPEEVNRVMTDHVSSMLFAPTDAAVENLHREGIGGERVHRVGDVMCDIAEAIAPVADGRFSSLCASLRERGLNAPEEGDNYGVVTVHRASNTEPEQLQRLVEIFESLTEQMPLYFPMHPRTEAAAVAAGVHVDLASIDGLTLLPPLGYIDMTALLRRAACAITDSGGLQKEAYIHRVPCVTLRDRTEWIETVDAGWNRLADLTESSVLRAVAQSLDLARDDDAEHPELYGDGHAADAILDVLIRHASATAALGL